MQAMFQTVFTIRRRESEESTVSMYSWFPCGGGEGVGGSNGASCQYVMSGNPVKIFHRPEAPIWP